MFSPFSPDPSQHLSQPTQHYAEHRSQHEYQQGQGLSAVAEILGKQLESSTAAAAREAYAAVTRNAYIAAGGDWYEL